MCAIFQGILELKQAHGIEHSTENRIQYFLDRFYMSRISIRMLINQHSESEPPAGKEFCISLFSFSFSFKKQQKQNLYLLLVWKLGLPYLVKATTAARTELPIPVSVCSMCVCPNSGRFPVFGVVSVHTDVNACDSTWRLCKHCKSLCCKLTLGEKSLATLGKSNGKSTCISIVSSFLVQCSPSWTLKGGWRCLMSLSCLEFQGCHLIPLSYLLACFVFSSAKASCSFCLAIFSANGPFSWLFFQKTQIFLLMLRLFCMVLVELLGDDSW